MNYTFEALIYGLLVFMPLALGAVMPWSEQVVVLAATAIVFVMFLQSLSRHRSFFHPAVLAAVLFCLIGGLQLLELPASIIGFLSPATLQIKGDLLGALPAGEPVQLDNASITFYSLATVQNLRLFGSVAVIFCAVLSYFNTLDRIKRILVVISVTGCGIGVLALLQDITLADKIYWVLPFGHKFANSGTFVNHSNYGQYMNLSIGATLALIFVMLRQRFAGTDHSPKIIFEYLASHDGRKVLWLCGGIVVCIASVFISLTRGGIIALIISGVVTTSVLACSKTGRNKGWLMVLVGLLAFMCVLYVGFDAVYDRLATLQDIEKAEGGRTQIIADIIEMSKKFPVLGTGLGTHPFVYPIFERSNIVALAYHAENEYAQVIEETGYVGLILLLVFAAIVIRAYIKCLRRIDVKGAASYAAYGLGFGILAILIQSLSDFGQHLPSNGILTAVSCALIIAISSMDNPPKNVTFPARAAASVFLLAVTSVFIVFCIQANNRRLAWDNYTKARDIERVLADNQWEGGQNQYIDMVRYADAAVKLEPNCINFRHWLNVYRWRMLSRQIDALDILNVQDDRLGDQIRGIVGKIVGEFENNIRIVPTFGSSWTMAGQLKYFVLGDKKGIEYINIGRRLGPNDPLTAYIGGLLDVKEYMLTDNTAARSELDVIPGIESFSRAVELRDSYFRNVADIYVKQLNMPQAAVSLCGDKVERLNYLALLMSTSENTDTALVTETQEKVFEILMQKSLEPDAPASVFASAAAICEKRGDIQNAVLNYEKALSLDYSQVSWRLKYASLLAQMGRKDDAVHQAKIVLRIKPGYAPAIKLIEKLVVE